MYCTKNQIVILILAIINLSLVAKIIIDSKWFNKTSISHPELYQQYWYGD